MLKLTLMDKHTSGTHALELCRHDDGDLGLTVWDMGGGAQFDFDLDDSDLEILSMIIERARKRKATPPQEQ